MAKTTLNSEGESHALALIRAGHYDMDGAWSFDAEDGNRELGPQGDDWDAYGRCHLGEDPGEPRDTKGHWKYPVIKGGKVYRRALAAVRSRASQQGDTTVFDAAGRLMEAMDKEESKKESHMSGFGSLGARLGSRFGHFAGPASPAAADPGATETPEARAAREAEEQEAKRAQEEEEEMRRARRSRRARSRQQQDDDEDEEDDASDDDEDEEDEDEAKRAQRAGHAKGLAAAFRRGARAQRRRCARIFSAASAAANPVLAMSLAFETTMTARAAIAVLDKTPAPAGRGGLAERMANSGAATMRVPPSAPDAPKGEAAVASSWDRAFRAEGLLPPPRAA